MTNDKKKNSLKTVRSLPPNHHYSPRPEKNKRNMRSKKLASPDQANSKFPVLPLHKWPEHHQRNLTKISANPALLKAIQVIKHIVPDQPLNKQRDDVYTTTRQAITNTDVLHNKKDNNIARKKQQQLINKAPKKAHKEILR